jgi:hypothetical protein
MDAVAPRRGDAVVDTGADHDLGTSDDTERWGYPNLHGDDIVTADAAGGRVGSRAKYDPFGQPIDPTTWAIGTQAVDDTTPDLIDGDTSR